MISTVLDTLCWLTGLAAIGAYVLALLRNRPYLRPLNSMGLLLVGGALLGVPRLYPHPLSAELTPYVIYIDLLLVGSALFQGLSAFRRRKARSSDAGPAGAQPAAPDKSKAFQ